MKSCIIFGGAGYIGTHLAKRFLETGRFNRIYIADIKSSPIENFPGIIYLNADVRRAIPPDLVCEKPEWIFNLAAVHREPGHEPREYFQTNIPGAKNVCEYAERTGCLNIYFTSSISVYGPTKSATSESNPLTPTTHYGKSKLIAELTHERWFRFEGERRLIISRPGVIYGPGDPGNILRMIRAVKRGYFAYPGKTSIYKSYGYIYGLLDSIEYLMAIDNMNFITYNYVETPTEPLSDLVNTIKEKWGCSSIVMQLPLWFLLPTSRIIQIVLRDTTSIHPIRVKKAATPTHIVPQTLLDLNYPFRYTFSKSLTHWQKCAPMDFL